MDRKTDNGDSCKHSVSLDADNCLSLASILEAFNGPINEEQAWALCYQTAKCIQSVHQKYQLYSISDAKYMFVHKDGSVHEKTITFTDGNRQLASSLSVILSTLGVTLFQALDYGISEEEERTLDSNLEILIEKLASSHPSQNVGECEEYRSSDDEKDLKDEGIERDSPDDESEHPLNFAEITIEKVIEMCISHLSCSDQADSHYKAVCRALVAETLELSTFLEKITKGTKELRKTSLFVVSEKLHDNSSNLDDLGVADWARLWMQVIRDLRRGVELKKVDLSGVDHRMEYELTPYEMLLDDIRLRRYKLNKVMVNGDIPQRMKKDAHALILEFIRSRPPLVPASKRLLRPPPPKQQTLYEKLMHSIRQQHKLKPTPPSSVKHSPIHLGRVMQVESSRTKLDESDNTPQPQRRLIKADLTLRLSNSYDDEEERFEIPSADELFTENVFDSSEQENEESKENVMKSDAKSVPINEPNSQPKSATLKKRFSFKNLSKVLSFEKHERRHSISVCESPSSKVSSGSSRQEHNNNQESDALVVDPNEDTRERVASIWAATAWGKTYDCLSLTLDEVQHIRSVLTKAELESLGVTKSLKEDLEKGRICFTCLKTRFSFFGPWPTKCRLCERLICEKCCTKMHVPTEHYAEIPIYMLSPTPTPSPPGDDDSSFFPSFPPNLLNQEQQTVKCDSKAKKSKLLRALTLKRTDFKEEETAKESDEHSKDLKSGEKRKGGPLMKLCRDCKLLVRHIIDVGYANYDSGFRKSWPRKGKSVARLTSSQCFQTEDENLENKEASKS